LKTIYDVIAMGIFAGLAILFLQRSANRPPDPIPIWKYGLPAVGCALADFLGNHDATFASIGVFLAVVVFSLMMLRPFHQGPST
jgi:hypothetical protein